MADNIQKPNTTKRTSSERTGTERMRSKRTNRKRKYNRKRRRQQKRQQILLIIGTICLILLLILVLSIRSCIHSRSGKNNDKETMNVVTNADNIENMDMEFEEFAMEETSETGNAQASLPDFAPVSLKISVVGDCTLGTDESFDYDTSVNAYYESNGSAYFMQNVKSIFAEDDLTIANFEGTLTTSEERADKQFAFKAPAEFAKIISDGAIETVNTANNHSHDYGDQSYNDTLLALDQEGIVHFGYDETQVVDVKGIKVGLVGIYELNDHLGVTQQLKDNIAKVKQDGAQLIVVIFHWGNELEQEPDEYQTTLGRLAIDEGADLVCGHHSHVLQGIETYKGKNICYSLGNFCFGGNSAPSDIDSIIYQQTFTVTPQGVQPDNVVNIIPCHITSEYGYNNYQPTPATGDEALRILQKVDNRSADISGATATVSCVQNSTSVTPDMITTSSSSSDYDNSYDYDYSYDYDEDYY